MIELRKLKADDIFPVLNIINKIGLKEIKDSIDGDKLAKMMKQDNTDFTSIGASVIVDMVQVVVKNLPACKTDIYNLFASLTGKTAKQIGEMEVVPFTEMLINFFKKEEFADFIKVVSKFNK